MEEQKTAVGVAVAFAAVAVVAVLVAVMVAVRAGEASRDDSTEADRTQCRLRRVNRFTSYTSSLLVHLLLFSLTSSDWTSSRWSIIIVRM